MRAIPAALPPGQGRKVSAHVAAAIAVLGALYLLALVVITRPVRAEVRALDQAARNATLARQSELVGGPR
jgi:hypothetical protein